MANPERLTRVMIATLGHQLRTPLTSISGYLETLLDGDVDKATSRRFLETARRETLRLGRLVEGMLDFSAVDLCQPIGRHGDRDEETGCCNVVEQIEATVEMVMPLAAARGVTIRKHLPQFAAVRVDADVCVHALANLVENAVKHGSEHGIVDVWCSCAERSVQIAVEDDGEGVAPADSESIFIMGVCTTRAGHVNRGIGLAIVKAIAEYAGGDVRVESSVLGGARFVLRLPAG